MGWRGALRSIAAAQRAAERESLRRHREYERASKQQAKVDALRQAAESVAEFENLLERITSIHKECGSSWDWSKIRDTPAPPSPSRLSHHEKIAIDNRDAFKPSWIDKLFRRVDKKRGVLEVAVEAGRKLDASAYSDAHSRFVSAQEDWSQMRELAERVIALEPEALSNATEELSPLSEITDLGSYISFKFRNDGTASAELIVKGDHVVPTEVLSLLQSRKLSAKKMPPARFHELYQDYVAGATIRIARELFALLPLHTIYVTACGSLLDTSSGHLTDQPILSVVFPRETISRLRFEFLDPSDALRNFNHRMEFRKNKGFVPIEPLLMPELGPTSSDAA